jgi:hypothetical protein
MCKPKPGPRCSSHASARLTTLQSNSETSSSQLRSAALEFNATPEGMAALKASEEASRGVRSLTADYVPGEHPKGSIFPVPAAGFYQADLETAEAHREWQTQTLKTLTDLREKKNLSESKLYAQLMMDSLRDQKGKMVNKGINYRDRRKYMTERVFALSSGKTETQMLATKEGISLVHNAHAEVRTRNEYLYNEMKIHDLEAYINQISGKM